MTTRAVGLGAGGHAKVVLDGLLLGSDVEIVGLLDPRPELRGREVCGVSVLGPDELLPALAEDGVTHAFVGAGSTGDAALRRRLFELLLERGLQPLEAIHPAASVSPRARLGRGVTIMAGAVVAADSSVGDNAIVNTGALVDHDCSIGPHAHVAPGACLAGDVSIADAAHVGLGACISNGVTVGADAIVGAGAVVIRDVQPGITVAGVPAREISPGEAR